MDDNFKIGGIGASEIGKLFTKDGVNAKTAKTLAVEKAEEIINGYKKNFTTIATQHGIFNEEEAFYSVVKPTFPNSVYQSDESILILNEENKKAWATPDVVDWQEGITIDIKCPYSITTYKQNISKLPESYIAQNQMQMMSTKHEHGYILVFLTSMAVDSWGNKIEYEIEINDRHKFIPLSADDFFQKEILIRLDDFFFMRDQVLIGLENAIEISDLEYFDLIIKQDKKATKLKDKYNPIAWDGFIYKTSTGFMVIE